MSVVSGGLPLARGGVLVPTSAGMLQYGAVPETIKDTMVLPEGVPSLFVVPAVLFDAERGISLAELEFPCYYNLFIKGRRTTVVCRREQRRLLETVLRESAFGPATLDPAEFGPGAPGTPLDLAAELAFFRRNPRKPGTPLGLDDLIEFVEFDERGDASLAGGVRIRAEDDGGASIVERGRSRTRLPPAPPLPDRRVFAGGALRAFWSPRLGVSVIGSGHGFDPGNRTSGFIIWIDGRGVLVDPPVDWLDWLSGYDIPPKQLDTLILTHCHADHDAGTLQKILHEGRISIFTTPTVMQSFVTKYSALTGMTPDSFRTLFDFVPVRTGEPIYLHGAELTFRYSLHSIPCAGFDVRLRGRSILYPSDTLNEPDRIRKLHAEGVLSQGRRDVLLDFPWHHTLVLHESGIPPIHTPIEYLATLEEEVKRRTFLLHTSEKIIPAGSGLHVAPTGLENTIDLAAEQLPVREALEVLDAIGRVELFSALPLGRAAELLRMARREIHPEGTLVLATGSDGDSFYIVLSGQAAVYREGRELKVYGAFDCFGETALLLNLKRTADVYAKSRLELLAIGKADFLYLVRGTDLPERLIALAHHRDLPTWELLGAIPVFTGMSVNQKTQLQTLMEPATLGAGESPDGDAFLIELGTIRVSCRGDTLAVLTAPAFAGDAPRLMRGEASPLSFTSELEARGYRVAAEKMKRFLNDNPGVQLQLAALAAVWEATRAALSRGRRVRAR